MKLRDRWVALLGLLVVGLFLVHAIAYAVMNTQHSGKIHDMKGCAEFIRHNVPANEIVFHASWDHFPELFFYDDTHRYLYGLAPDLLYLEDPALYRLWDSIRSGSVYNPSKSIRDSFNASAIVIDNRYHLFEQRLRNDPEVLAAYHAKDCRVYLIRTQGQPQGPATLLQSRRSTNAS